MTAGDGEGERVFAPPLGTCDADWVAAMAVQDDAGLDPATPSRSRAALTFCAAYGR